MADGPSSGARQYDADGVQVHQEGISGGGNYHSGARSDGSGGRFITVGDSANHTTFLYDSSGNFAGSSSRGDGGPAANAKP